MKKKLLSIIVLATLLPVTLHAQDKAPQTYWNDKSDLALKYFIEQGIKSLDGDTKPLDFTQLTDGPSYLEWAQYADQKVPNTLELPINEGDFKGVLLIHKASSGENYDPSRIFFNKVRDKYKDLLAGSYEEYFIGNIEKVNDYGEVKLFSLLLFVGEKAPTPTEPEEPQTYTLILEAVGDKKIAVIKAVRDHTGLGLKEAKDKVDNAPTELTVDSAEKLEGLTKALKEAGATVNTDDMQKQEEATDSEGEIGKAASISIDVKPKAEQALMNELGLEEMQQDPILHRELQKDVANAIQANDIDALKKDQEALQEKYRMAKKAFSELDFKFDLVSFPGIPSAEVPLACRISFEGHDTSKEIAFGAVSVMMKTETLGDQKKSTLYCGRVLGQKKAATEDEMMVEKVEAQPQDATTKPAEPTSQDTNPEELANELMKKIDTAKAVASAFEDQRKVYENHAIALESTYRVTGDQGFKSNAERFKQKEEEFSQKYDAKMAEIEELEKQLYALSS